MYSVRDALLGLCLLVCVALGVVVYIQQGALSRAQDSAQSAEAVVQGYRTQAKETVQFNHQKEAAHAQLESRLEDNPVWADQPVPDDLADLLRKH